MVPNPLFFKKINTLLLIVFIFLLPVQFGKHFFFDFSYLSGIRVDYLAPTVYLIDIVFLFLLLINIKTIKPLFQNKKLFIFIFLIFLNLLFAQNKLLATYYYLRLIEIILIFFIYKKNKLSAKEILFPLIFSSFIQLVLVLDQFMNKHSIQGIFYFFGERYFNLSTPGIAKASLSGIEFLRPYGSFSHPNSLAGFYLLLYFFILTNRKFNKLTLLKNIFLFISSILVLISFSKIAIVSFLILNTGYWILNTKNKCILCLIAKISVFFIVSLIFLTAQTDPLTIKKRIFLIQNSFLIIRQNLFFGAGAGNYLLAQNKLSQQYLDIINQPVHNIFILFFSQWGMISFGLLSLTINWLKEVPKKYYFLFLVIIITGFFDHYWISLVQNFLLLPVVFSLL